MTFPPTVAPKPARSIEVAKVAVAVTFAANGLAFGSWASRTPSIKAALDLDASQLGLLLLCLSVGSLTALPLSGSVVQRIGPAATVVVSVAAESGGLLMAAWGVSTGQATLCGAGLLLTGFGVGMWDVAMNVQGAAVERKLGRNVMSRFHAAWSLGSVAGAGAGALCAAIGMGVATQLVITAAVTAVLAIAGTRRYLPFEPEPSSGHGYRAGAAQLGRQWRDSRTLRIGCMVLGFAFVEGVANDWLAVAVVSGLGISEAIGAVAFGVFVAAMTVGRLVGASALDRWGRLRVLRASVLLVAAGLLLVAVGPGLPAVLAGSLIWGIGAALGFPTGISAAADDPATAAIGVSVVTSIGYTAFLAGPPLVGFLGDAVGIRPALLVVLGALALVLVTHTAARPLAAVEVVEAVEPGER